MQSINSRPAGECGCGEEHDTHAYIYLNPCTIPLAAVIAARMLTERWKAELPSRVEWPTGGPTPQ